MTNRRKLEPSRCYQLYVQDDTDIQSLIAYALYKKQKTQFVETLATEGANNNDVSKAINNFIATHSNSSIIEGNMERAKKLLALYQSNIFSGETKKILVKLEGTVNEINSINESKNQYPNLLNIGLNLLSNFIWVVFVGLGVFITTLVDNDFYKNTIVPKAINILKASAEDLDKKDSTNVSK